MAKVFRTAMGKQIDVDSLLLTNDHVIAIGNMKVNARGDELGPGGKVVKTRDQIMKEYYALNTPVATDPQDNPKADHPKAKSSTAAPKHKQIVDEPIVISPESGLDEIDDGPEVLPPVVVPTPKLAATPPQQKSQPSKVQQPQPQTAELIVADIPPPPPAPVLDVYNDERLVSKFDKESVAPATPAMRGKMAEAVAKPATVNQAVVPSAAARKKAAGIQRF